nr:solute carrier family 22 member 3-like [Cherax quadricarinatus]
MIPIHALQNERRDASNLLQKQKTTSGEASSVSCLAWYRRIGSHLLVFVRTPMLRRISLVLYFNWLTCTMVYYGISLNSANFSVDPFLYMFLGGLVELPSSTLILPFVTNFGRKIPLVIVFVLCGLSILVLLLLPQLRLIDVSRYFTWVKVRNVPFEAYETDLQNVFSRYGTVHVVTVGKWTEGAYAGLLEGTFSLKMT